MKTILFLIVALALACGPMKSPPYNLCNDTYGAARKVCRLQADIMYYRDIKNPSKLREACSEKDDYLDSLSDDARYVANNSGSSLLGLGASTACLGLSLNDSR